MITITHTHEDGTLIHGTSKGDGVYEIVRPFRFRYFPSIKMIGIAQSRDHLAKRWQIESAAEALRAAGHEVTVEIDDTPRDVAEVKADRAERLDARADRLTAASERAASEAESRFAAADHYSERFAGGQPILVGHHSERSARADHKRMDGHMRAGVAAADKAERVSRAAAVVGKADAYRERPGVIIRRIDKTEAELRQTMHYINGTRPANDWRGAYSMDRTPASGAYLEQLTARKTFLEHQIKADREALAEHEANGYVRHSRETIHKGDIVTWLGAWGDGVYGAKVTRTNPKTVTLDRRSYPRTLPYEQIKTVQCPHAELGAPGPVAPEPQPEPQRYVPPQPVRPDLAERAAAWKNGDGPAPILLDARTEYFPTPPAVVARMIDAADLAPGMEVLEPSAGLGAIATAVATLGCNVDCIEMHEGLADRLADVPLGIPRTITRADFLTITPQELRMRYGQGHYDRVMMNPPFSGQADIRHVTHALGFLKPGGRLVAVMSAGAEFRADKTAEAFRKLVADRGGWIERLPDDAFKSSGTSVRAVMAVIPG